MADSETRMSGTPETNPYESPLTVSAPPSAKASLAASYGGGAIVPRTIAASIDEIVAILLAFSAAAILPEDLRLLQVFVMMLVWLAYFLLAEGTFSMTLGKLLVGQIVLQVDGTRITWRQAIVRTLFRLLEVNPILLGAVPAGPVSSSRGTGSA